MGTIFLTLGFYLIDLFIYLFISRLYFSLVGHLFFLGVFVFLFVLYFLFVAGASHLGTPPLPCCRVYLPEGSFCVYLVSQCLHLVTQFLQM